MSDTPRTNSILERATIDIDGLPQSGPITLRHWMVISTIITSLGTESKQLERELAAVTAERDSAIKDLRETHNAYLEEMHGVSIRADQYKAERDDALHGLRLKTEHLRHDYNELIMAVHRKHPGETRHQTALRYIQEAERAALSGVANTKSEDGP